jgi:hypothetical protein
VTSYYFQEQVVTVHCCMRLTMSVLSVKFEALPPMFCGAPAEVTKAIVS